MSGILNKLKSLRDENKQEFRTEQSRLDSLKMNALKSSTPLIIRAAKESKLDETIYGEKLASLLKQSISLQMEIEKNLFSTLGPINIQDNHIYRQSWSLGAKSIAGNTSYENARLANSINLLLLRNDELAHKTLERATFSESDVISFQSAMRQIIGTSVFDEDGSYYSSIDSTLAAVSQKICNTITSIDFGSCHQEAFDLATSGCMLFTNSLLQLFNENAHRKQELMRFKSCINHASSMFMAVFETSASHLISRKMDLATFEAFEENLNEQSQFVTASLSYVVNLVSTSLLDRTNNHSIIVQKSLQASFLSA
jgi:hypothetical protein